jgi:uncharacterized membrane protein YoaK (UPF0700 family)
MAKFNFHHPAVRIFVHSAVIESHISLAFAAIILFFIHNQYKAIADVKEPMAPVSTTAATLPLPSAVIKLLKTSITHKITFPTLRITSHTNPNTLFSVFAITSIIAMIFSFFFSKKTMILSVIPLILLYVIAGVAPRSIFYQRSPLLEN